MHISGNSDKKIIDIAKPLYTIFSAVENSKTYNYFTFNEAFVMDNLDITLIGACGIFCENCSIYIATKENNDDLKKQIAKKIFPDKDPELVYDKIVCYGCHGPIDTHWSPDCKILDCSREKEYTICAECSNFPCDISKKFYGSYDHAKYKSAIYRIRKIGLENWINEKSKSKNE